MREKLKFPASAPSLTSPSLLALSLLAAAGAGAVATYALEIEPYLLEVTHTDVPLPRLPAPLDGVRVLLLADTHISRWGRREPLILDALREIESPDLIVWAGDFLQGRSGVPHVLRLVRDVAERYPGVPTYGIHGNAEHKIPRAEREAFARSLEEAGRLKMLVNSATALSLRGEKIRILGVDDPYYGHADLAAVLAAVPKDDLFTLLLAHSPQVATQAARAGIDLMLSGHTHGGQVRLPVVGPLKTQNPLARRFDCGLWDRDALARVLKRDPGGNMVTYISRGIGVATLPRVWWIAPRLLCRPEIAVLTLRSASTAGTDGNEEGQGI